MEKQKEDVLTTETDKKGLAGLAELFLRRFRTLSFMFFLIPVMALCVFCIGLALSPGVAVVQWTFSWSGFWPWYGQALALGVALAFGYLLYGLSIIFIMPTVNFLLPLRVRPWRGNWRSSQTIPWYIHNALVYIVRYSFLDLMTPSPLTNLFYKMMGMKIGKGVLINTTNISDPCLITLEDYVTIGGSVTLLAHYGQKGYLVLAPVHIKKGANIGLKASVMGDVVIGENATVKPHAVVLPKTRINDNEVY